MVERYMNAKYNQLIGFKFRNVWWSIQSHSIAPTVLTTVFPPKLFQRVDNNKQVDGEASVFHCKLFFYCFGVERSGSSHSHRTKENGINMCVHPPLDESVVMLLDASCILLHPLLVRVNICISHDLILK